MITPLLLGVTYQCPFCRCRGSQCTCAVLCYAGRGVHIMHCKDITITLFLQMSHRCSSLLFTAVHYADAEDPDAPAQCFAMLAVGCKAGIVWLWRYQLPSHPAPSGSVSPDAFTLVLQPSLLCRIGSSASSGSSDFLKLVLHLFIIGVHHTSSLRGRLSTACVPCVAFLGSVCSNAFRL